MKRSIVALLTALITHAAVAELPQLDEAWDGKFRVGCAIGRKLIKEPHSPIGDLVRSQYNQFTAENAMKWATIQPEPDRFDFTRADGMMDIAEAAGGNVHGHVFIWHEAAPDWIFEDKDGKPLTRDALLARMRDHIYTVGGRYRGRIQSWDVVNEALNNNGTLRDTKWREIIGDDYILHAFRFAAKAAPDAMLVYNDYLMTLPAKRDGAVRIVKQLQDAGLRIDAVGMQGHWQLNGPSLEAIEASIVAFRDVGVKVMITELDIDVLPKAWEHIGADVSALQEYKDELNPYTEGLPEEIQQQQAERYKALFELFAKHNDTIEFVTFWGTHDGKSWLNNFPVKGRTNYPMLFDRELQPKPAFFSVIDAAEEARAHQSN